MVNRDLPNAVKVSFTFRPSTLQRLREIKEETKLPMCRIVEYALEKNLDNVILAFRQHTEELLRQEERQRK